MKMKKISNFLLIVMLSSLSSCATLFNPSYTKVWVTGNPNDATILYNGVYQGQGKAFIKVQKSAVAFGDASILIKRDGFENFNVPLKLKNQAEFYLIDVACGIIPLFIDLSTGKMKGVSPSNISFDLKKSLDIAPATEYEKSLIGKSVRFSIFRKNYEGIITETLQNREANIRYFDENKITKFIWKRFDEITVL
jgi:hypothetical protein